MNAMDKMHSVEEASRFGLDPITTPSPKADTLSGVPDTMSFVFARDPEMIKRETRIVGRESEYLKWRKGAVGLAAASLLLLVLQIAIRQFVGHTATGLTPMTYSVITAMSSVFLWSLVAYVAHARYQHAKCARLYREYIAQHHTVEVPMATAGKPSR